MRMWLRRLAYLLRQSRHDADLREEIEAHRALRAAHLEREGLTPRQAADASQRAIGNVLLAREDVRDLWLGSWATWWHDVRYGLRSFRRNPMFTAVAVVTLALGIGVNAGIFTVLNGVLFRDVPAPDAHELTSIQQKVEGVQAGVTGEDTFSTSEYRTYRDRARTLSGVLALGRGPMTILGGDAAQLIIGMFVSCNYFEVLRQPPALGRGLIAQDCEPGADPIVVLGHNLWTTTFAADREILGRTVTLNRRSFTVVGVAAEGTYSGVPASAGYFVSISTEPILRSSGSRFQNDTQKWLYLIGRRNEGRSLDQVRAELGVIAADIDRQEPGRSTTLTVERANAMTILPRGTSLGAAAVLMAAFGFVLLIACANVANLLLARGIARSQEIGIRLSLGASRARVIRQLVTESLLISSAGGLLGVVLAVWSFQSLVALALPAALPPDLSFLQLDIDLSPDVRVLSFAVALTLVTGLLVGLVPASHTSRQDLHVVIKPDSPGTGSGQRSGRLQRVLVGVQVAACMTLMIATGLLVRGLYATYTIDPGFEYRDVAFVSLESALDVYSADEMRVLRERLRDAIEVLPGVEAVAFADREPLGDDSAAILFRLPGESQNGSRVAQLTNVTRNYFSVLELPIVRGRTFTEAEIGNLEGTTRPAIVSEATARNLWPGGDPIGRTLHWDDNTLQVVGVVADAQVTSLGRIDPYHVYLPGGASLLLVKSRTDLGTTASSIRAAARTLDPALLVNVFPLEASLGWWRGVSTIVTTLGGALGVLALVLASVGIYGVVSYSVTQRYREFGIRMALGATAQTVLGMVLRQTMRPVVVGAAIGVAAAIGMSRILTGVLFGISPADPVGLGGGALLVLGVALAAGLMAARPVTRADPTAALRQG
jgi:predicted permease